MINTIRKFLTAIIVSALFVGIRPAIAGAPELTLDILRETKVGTASKVESMIKFTAKEYKFNNSDLLVLLAGKESSMGMDKRCGDRGKSCFLFQIQKPTGDDFTKEMNRNDLVYSNYVDQTIVTIGAISNGYANRGSPIRLGLIKM